MLELGKMRDLLIVEKLVSVQNAYNEDVPTYEGICEVWGYLRHLSGRQLQLTQANTITATATHMASVHYIPELEQVGKYRLKLEQVDGSFRTFAINDINDPDNVHAEMHLTVTEVKG